jgi:hypothetical protein
VFAPFGANTHPVPTISRFYGIDIFMWFNDHEPPHFHARYGAYEAKIAIESGEVLSGELPGSSFEARAKMAIRVEARSHEKLGSRP